MARGDHETGLNLTILKTEDAELERLCEKYETGAGKYWLARLFMRHGMRHARSAIQEAATIAAQGFPPDYMDEIRDEGAITSSIPNADSS
jgi:hypothetical protein